MFKYRLRYTSFNSLARVLLPARPLTVKATDGFHLVIAGRGRVGHGQADVVADGEAVLDVRGVALGGQHPVLEGSDGVSNGFASPVHQVSVQVRRDLIQL